MSNIGKSTDPTGFIDRLYEGAEFEVTDSNVISIDFSSPERAMCLIEDIAAVLEDPQDARIAEPVLREALQHIASKILAGS